MLSGLRIGELLGLMWEDVDLRARTLRVRRQLIRARSGIAFAPPTRTASKRAVEVGERILNALRRNRKTQLEEKLRAGSLWQENYLVFATKEASPSTRPPPRSDTFIPSLSGRVSSGSASTPFVTRSQPCTS